MTKIRGILFDYGHTLGDLLGWEAYLERLHGTLLPLLEAELRSLDGQGPAQLTNVLNRVKLGYEDSYLRRQLEEQDIFQLYRDAFAAYGITLSAARLDEVVEAEHQVFAQSVLVPQATEQALALLRGRGLRLGVVSNNIFLHHKARQLFPLLQQESGAFDGFVFSSEVGLRKPHVKIYEAAFAALKLRPEEAVFVGDRLREDIRAPKALGISRAFLTHEFRQEADESHEADAVLSQLPDLLDLV